MKTKAIIIGLSVAVLLGSCTGKKTTKEEAAAYKTMTVETTDVILLSEYSARLEGQQTVEVRPEVGGKIVEIRIQEGDKVRRGQTLFVIDRVPYQAAYDEAKASEANAAAQLATAQLTLESTEQLHQGRVVGDYELKTARNAVASSKAALQQAKAKVLAAAQDLLHSEVKSPADGVAGMIPYRVGSLVSSSIAEPLVTISNASRMFAYFSMTEKQVTELIAQYGSIDNFLKQMPEVGLLMAGGKEYSEKGRIAAVSRIVSQGIGAVTLRADFDNSRGMLIGGGSATVVIPTLRKNAIVVPQGATYELQNKTFAYKMVNGKPQSTPVDVFRLNNGTEFVVEKGLKAGDVIISEGAGLVRMN
ncbi:MAG: efflux RND transporter periplasmic adaptor subunit [Prevotella sp.]